MDPQVLAAMQPYFAEKFYNPSATYAAARAVKKDLEKARARVAQVLGAKPVEIIFTAGGTEANNLAICGVLEQFPEGNIVTSAIEHESVLAPAELYEHRLAPVKPDGIVDLEKLAKLIDEKTVLVSIMYANNEVGTVQPIRDIAKLIAAKRANHTLNATRYPLYFHADAAQAANYLDLHVARLGVDLMTLNGGKIYGPKQSGALFVHSGVELKPHILGGGQERNLRSGTENVAGSIGFAAALELTQAMRRDESTRLAKLQQLFFDLLQAKLPQANSNGSRAKRLPNNVHVTFPGVDNERLLIQLDEAGIQCAAGSACSASSDEPSHVLKAMSLSEADARSSLRFSLGRDTTAADIERTIRTLVQLHTNE